MILFTVLELPVDRATRIAVTSSLISSHSQHRKTLLKAIKPLNQAHLLSTLLTRRLPPTRSYTQVYERLQTLHRLNPTKSDQENHCEDKGNRVTHHTLLRPARKRVSVILTNNTDFPQPACRVVSCFGCGYSVESWLGRDMVGNSSEFVLYGCCGRHGGRGLEKWRGTFEAEVEGPGW